MGVAQSTFASLPECVCQNQLLTHDANMDGEAHWIESSQKFCPQCKRIVKRQSPNEQSYRKHNSFNDSLLHRTESATSVYLTSSKSLPSVNSRNGHIVSSSPPKSSLSLKRFPLNGERPSSPSTPPKQLSKISSLVLSPIDSPTNSTFNSESPMGRSQNTSPKNSTSFNQYSFQTKLARSSSKNLMLLGASGGKLPEQVTTPIPIVKVKKKTSCSSLPTYLPPLSPPTLEKLEAPPLEEVQKIAVNLGNAFPNHGTRSFPIYVLPPQEAPEFFNPKGKKLGDHRSQMEEKHTKRRVRRVVVQ